MLLAEVQLIKYQCPHSGNFLGIFLSFVPKKGNLRFPKKISYPNSRRSSLRFLRKSSYLILS